MNLELDRRFMLRAMQLAELGMGKVSPNPLVGCVVVYDGRIIGEGWHKYYGGPHAEVYALQDLNDSKILSESTVYVTLEPCCHFGKTPPCADLLLAKGIKRLIVAQKDPNPIVAGKGLAKLQNAGVEVMQGLLEAEAKFQNRRFWKNMLEKRPYIVLKYAQTADGFIAQSNSKPLAISNSLSNRLVHSWRAQEDAILVGSGTVRADNPLLTARFGQQKQPQIVVLDRFLRLTTDYVLKNNPHVWFMHQALESEFRAGYYSILNEDFWVGVFQKLLQLGIGSVLVEGGLTVHNALIERNLWDEARIIVSNKKLGQGLEAPKGLNTGQANIEKIGHDSHFRYFKP